MLPCLDTFSIGIATGMSVHLLFEKYWKLKLKLQYGYQARSGFSNLDLEDLTSFYS